MKTTLLVLWLTALTVVAQTNSVPIPGATQAVPNVELSKLLLVVIVPLVVAGIKKLATKLPTAMIPVLAIALGAGADYAGSLLNLWNGSFVIGATLGAAAIGVREVGDQLRKVGGTEPPPVT